MCGRRRGWPIVRFRADSAARMLLAVTTTAVLLAAGGGSRFAGLDAQIARRTRRRARVSPIARPPARPPASTTSWWSRAPSTLDIDDPSHHRAQSRRGNGQAGSLATGACGGSRLRQRCSSSSVSPISRSFRPRRGTRSPPRVRAPRSSSPRTTVCAGRTRCGCTDRCGQHLPTEGDEGRTARDAPSPRLGR